MERKTNETKKQQKVNVLTKGDYSIVRQAYDNFCLNHPESDDRDTAFIAAISLYDGSIPVLARIDNIELLSDGNRDIKCNLLKILLLIVTDTHDRLNTVYPYDPNNIYLYTNYYDIMNEENKNI